MRGEVKLQAEYLKKSHRIRYPPQARNIVFFPYHFLFHIFSLL